LSSLPAGVRKARAGGRRSAPSLPRRDAGNGHRDGRAAPPHAWLVKNVLVKRAGRN